MAIRCEYDEKIKAEQMTWQQVSDQLYTCDRCVHYHYCQKVCEMNDRLKELED